MYGSGAILYGKDTKRLMWMVGDVVYAFVDLPTNAKVLDVGSGQNPHPSADFILDKFLDDNRHRQAKSDFTMQASMMKLDKEGNLNESEKRFDVAQGDILALPFPDKSFDFIIARHMLEHVEDIQGALKELSRVGKAGYIEVPTKISELLFPQVDIHLWTFSLQQGALVARSLKGNVSPFGRVLHDHFANCQEFQVAWAKAYHQFHICLCWKDEITCEIEAE
jgi:ubiquinone/menaquinone biosynthesis C-methylase UbiE